MSDQTVTSKLEATSRVVFIYQRMLPYHKCRFEAVAQRLSKDGVRCVALEVASTDTSYGELDERFANSPLLNAPYAQRMCLFPANDYLRLTPKTVGKAVFKALCELQPRVVFSPAPAFAEGASALHYKVRQGGKLILMDDAWSETDQRGWLTRIVKWLFFSYVDGGFFPSTLHGRYFAALNIPLDRQAYPVDVVGNEQVTPITPLPSLSHVKNAPYFLFVGRLIARKGLDTLLQALANLPRQEVNLVVIGEGPERSHYEAMARRLFIDGRISWLGRVSNQQTRHLMAGAIAVVVPSHYEQWGLVVNEAWMACVPVLGSNTVGALKATMDNERRWTTVPPGHAEALCNAMKRIMQLNADERESLVNAGLELAQQYSITQHTNAVIQLINLTQRARPLPLIGWLACLWRGKVVVW